MELMSGRRWMSAEQKRERREEAAAKAKAAGPAKAESV